VSAANVGSTITLFILGNGIAPLICGPVSDRIGELMLKTTLTCAVIQAAEVDAKPDARDVMYLDPVTIENVRILFMTAYPQTIEVREILGSSRFVITLNEADMAGLLAGRPSSTRDRIKLSCLVRDVVGTSFGSRQVLFERFFSSDPLTRARTLAAICPKQVAMQRVLDFHAP
jgi:4-hydroxyphenylacetate 3-monooxygenase